MPSMSVAVSSLAAPEHLAISLLIESGFIKQRQGNDEVLA